MYTQNSQWQICVYEMLSAWFIYESSRSLNYLWVFARNGNTRIDHERPVAFYEYLFWQYVQVCLWAFANVLRVEKMLVKRKGERGEWEWNDSPAALTTQTAPFGVFLSPFGALELTPKNWPEQFMVPSLFRVPQLHSETIPEILRSIRITFLPFETLNSLSTTVKWI